MRIKARGKGWFAVQFLLFCGILLAPFISQPRLPSLLRPIGAIALIAGILIAVRGYRTLGSSHSPWTNPTEAASFVSTGIYSRIRHPIYAGWILGALGLELVALSPVGVGVAVALLVYYDFRTREEERWLVATYGDYLAYLTRVKRFIPFLY